MQWFCENWEEWKADIRGIFGSFCNDKFWRNTSETFFLLFWRIMEDNKHNKCKYYDKRTERISVPAIHQEGCGPHVPVSKRSDFLLCLVSGLQSPLFWWIFAANLFAGFQLNILHDLLSKHTTTWRHSIDESHYPN